MIEPLPCRVWLAFPDNFEDFWYLTIAQRRFAFVNRARICYLYSALRTKALYEKNNSNSSYFLAAHGQHCLGAIWQFPPVCTTDVPASRWLHERRLYAREGHFQSPGGSAALLQQ